MELVDFTWDFKRTLGFSVVQDKDENWGNKKIYVKGEVNKPGIYIEDHCLAHWILNVLNYL